jgi:hypothetical protein
MRMQWRNETSGVVERFGRSVVDRVQQNGQERVTLKDGFQFTLTKEALLGRLELDMAPIARAIPTSVAVLTLHGADDRVIPVDDAREFDKLIPNHRLVILPAATHNFSSREADVAAVIREFMGAARGEDTDHSEAPVTSDRA